MGGISGIMKVIRKVGTDIAQPTSSGSSFAQYDSNSGELHNVAFHFLDSPSTTSSITYKTQFRNYSGTGTAYVNIDGSTAQITLLEIAG